MREWVRKLPGKVGEVFGPDILWRTGKWPPVHFREYGSIGKKFDIFVLARVCAFYHSLLRQDLVIEIAHGTSLV